MSEHTPLTEAERDEFLSALRDWEYKPLTTTDDDLITTINRILAARTTATADTGLRERVEALAEEWETAHGDPPIDPSHISVRHAMALRAVLDATAAPTTDTGARDE